MMLLSKRSRVRFFNPSKWATCAMFRNDAAISLTCPASNIKGSAHWLATPLKGPRVCKVDKQNQHCIALHCISRRPALFARPPLFTTRLGCARTCERSNLLLASSSSSAWGDNTAESRKSASLNTLGALAANSVAISRWPLLCCAIAGFSRQRLCLCCCV